MNTLSFHHLCQQKFRECTKAGIQELVLSFHSDWTTYRTLPTTTKQYCMAGFTVERHKLFEAEESMVYWRVRDSGGFGAKRHRLPTHLKDLLTKGENHDEGVGSIYGRCIT